MTVSLRDLNLLDLRRSERAELAALLEKAPREELENLSRNIEDTLSKFATVFPENEEQIYLFGLDMRNLLASMKVARTIPSFRDHPEPDVMMVFGGGFLGLAFAETLEKLEADRRTRRAELRANTAEREARRNSSEANLVRDIEEMVAETAAAVVPPR
jgi:hypothetical protein